MILKCTKKYLSRQKILRRIEFEGNGNGKQIWLWLSKPNWSVSMLFFLVIFTYL